MQTKGEHRVGSEFNPSADPMVTSIKAKAAELIDLVESIAAKSPEVEAEVGRLKSLAQTHFEDAAMWAVKAATKRPRS